MWRRKAQLTSRPRSRARWTAERIAPEEPPQASTRMSPWAGPWRARGGVSSATADHGFVVGRVVADVSGVLLFFEATDAVLEARGSGGGPGADEALVAAIGLEARGGGGRRGLESGEVGDVRDLPGLGAVGDVE